MEERTINILIATGLYPPEIGGPATYVRMLEENLDTKQVAITVVPFLKVRQYPKIIRHAFFLLLLLKNVKGKDAIYSLDPVSVGVPSYIVSLLTRKPFFVRMAGDYAWEQAQLRRGVRDPLAIFYKKRYSYGFFVSVLSFVESFITRKAQVVILPCAYLKDVMKVWSVDESRIHVVYSALFPLTVLESKDELRKEFGYTGTVITSAGRLVPNKGFTGLIEVFAQMLAVDADLHLIIAGDGPQEEELKMLVQQKQITDSVTFTGMLPKADLGKVLKASDLFVLNTEHEGFSHQLLEVMDLEVPVVATAVGGNPELVIDGQSGFLVPFGDAQKLTIAMRTLITDQTIRETFVQNARQRTKLFEKKKLIEEITYILRDSCNR